MEEQTYESKDTLMDKQRDRYIDNWKNEQKLKQMDMQTDGRKDR